MAMKESSRNVFEFLKANYGTPVTGSVNGLVKKGLAVRNEEVVAGTDGKDTKVKYISLTEAGLSFDPDAEPVKEAKAE